MTEVIKRIAVCGICGGPRSPFGGRVCRLCYAKPDVRATYLNASASKPLVFATARFETVTVEARVRKPRVTKPRRYIDRGVVWSGQAVPINLYASPTYTKAQERLRALDAPENIWQPGQVDLPQFRAKPVFRKARDVRVALNYPYIVKATDDHADLLSVHSLVPPMPGREDICQEIMLALWEGKITIADLRANRHRVREFVRGFNKANYESGGYAVSLDEPLASGASRYDRLSESDGLWV